MTRVQVETDDNDEDDKVLPVNKSSLSSFPTFGLLSKPSLSVVLLIVIVMVVMMMVIVMMVIVTKIVMWNICDI